MRHEEAITLLSQHGQEHLLKFYDTLGDAERAALLAQIATLDFAAIAQMRAMLEGHLNGGAQPSRQAVEIFPAPVERLAGTAAPHLAIGEAELRAGKVAALLVAGGQGSRLGYEGPKGCYEIGPVSNAPLFYFHARKILALKQRYGRPVPLYIMTSETNDAQTRGFFATHKYFGLDCDDVVFFVQSMWPALDAAGRIILETPGRISMAADGHGGTISALAGGRMSSRAECAVGGRMSASAVGGRMSPSAAAREDTRPPLAREDTRPPLADVDIRPPLADMRRRGVEHVFFFQVDNPLVDVCSPSFVGFHKRHNADVSVKVCAKADPLEKVGVPVERDGKTLIVEYTEFTEAQQRELAPDGELRYKYGSVNILLFSRAFLEKEAAAGLPLHIAHKKIATVDDTGAPVKPAEPNAYKFEKFIFDALADADVVKCLEFDRAEEFAPVKNASGVDSPATCRAALVAKWRRWLEAAGFAPAPGANIEIDPAFADSAQALVGKSKDVEVDAGAATIQF